MADNTATMEVDAGPQGNQGGDQDRIQALEAIVADLTARLNAVSLGWQARNTPIPPGRSGAATPIPPRSGVAIPIHGGPHLNVLVPDCLQRITAPSFGELIARELAKQSLHLQGQYAPQQSVLRAELYRQFHSLKFDGSTTIVDFNALFNTTVARLSTLKVEIQEAEQLSTYFAALETPFPQWTERCRALIRQETYLRSATVEGPGLSLRYFQDDLLAETWNTTTSSAQALHNLRTNWQKENKGTNTGPPGAKAPEKAPGKQPSGKSQKKGKKDGKTG